MTNRRSEYVSFNDSHTHASTWGDSNNPAIIMWPGLARTGRDFDEAAEYFSKDYFAICADTIGRGLSSWANNPETDYNLETYGAQALSLLEHYNIDQMRWLGTSMGALITTISARRRGLRAASPPIYYRSRLLKKCVGVAPNRSSTNLTIADTRQHSPHRMRLNCSKTFGEVS